MTIDEHDVRERCTEAVFERGERYREEGRIHRLTRFGDTITATVRGTRTYELTLELSETADLSATTFDARCSCPYDGPGDCKHVAAVLLELADGLPSDEGARVDAILEDVPPEALREFVRGELARDPATCERFVAQFGGTPGKSVDEYREEVDRLFAEHMDEHPIVEVIDFSRFTDLAARYRERGNYRQAAAIHRALAEGIDGNMRLVDAAYDHYVQSFRRALDAYVECVSMADLEAEERRAHVEFLSERANAGTDYLREHYDAALSDLRTREDGSLR